MTNQKKSICDIEHKGLISLLYKNLFEINKERPLN
jgi:hypothetical protein